jgi:hypothetical protein
MSIAIPMTVPRISLVNQVPPAGFGYSGGSAGVTMLAQYLQVDPVVTLSFPPVVFILKCCPLCHPWGSTTTVFKFLRGKTQCKQGIFPYTSLQN